VRWLLLLFRHLRLLLLLLLFRPLKLLLVRLPRLLLLLFSPLKLLRLSLLSASRHLRLVFTLQLEHCCKRFLTLLLNRTILKGSKSMRLLAGREITGIATISRLYKHNFTARRKQLEEKKVQATYRNPYGHIDRCPTGCSLYEYISLPERDSTAGS
jgi:hypothetical protein